MTRYCIGCGNRVEDSSVTPEGRHERCPGRPPNTCGRVDDAVATGDDVTKAIMYAQTPTRAAEIQRAVRDVLAPPNLLDVERIRLDAKTLVARATAAGLVLTVDKHSVVSIRTGSALAAHLAAIKLLITP